MAVPAYAVMQADGKLGSRMLEILLRGVSARQYQRVLPEMASTVGVAKSSVSTAAIEASEGELKELCERRWDKVELLVIYLDGIVFGEHHVLTAVGVDAGGNKHVLGIAEGASENQVVMQGLLERLVERGLDPKRPYLFVIDGSKAVRAEARRRMHAPVTDQHHWLCQVLRGHYAYYGLPSNFGSLNAFHQQGRLLWFRSLRRRSQRRLNWDGFTVLLQRFPLLPPRITHPLRAA